MSAVELEDKRVVIVLGGGLECLEGPRLAVYLRTQGAAVELAAGREALRFLAEEALSAAAVVDLSRATMLSGADAAILLPGSAGLIEALTASPEPWAVTLRALGRRLLVVTSGGSPAFGAAQFTPVALEAPGAAWRERVCEELWAALQLQDLSGRKFLITAGPTIEDIDPVRFLSNRSSGLMGVALARAAAARGAAVTLVHGPLQAPLTRLAGVTALAVRSAAEMHRSVLSRAADQDAAILCAAVCDFTPAQAAAQKLKKESNPLVALEWVRTPDILADLAKLPRRPYLVGFAAKSENVEHNARAKLMRKGCDMICANDITLPGAGFSAAANRISIITADGEQRLPLQSKQTAAAAIIDAVRARIFR